MGIRKQRATARDDIIDTNYDNVLKKAKVRYRHEKEFYLFRVYKGSDYWSAGFVIDNPERAEEHWKFNESINRWEKI